MERMGVMICLLTRRLCKARVLRFWLERSLLTGCAGGPLSTREKGAGIGALGGAATVLSSARRWVIQLLEQPSAAAILTAALLVGDQLQGHEITNSPVRDTAAEGSQSGQK